MMNNQDSMLNLESQTKGFDSTCEDEFQSESLVQNSLVLSQNSLNRFPYHLSYKFALKDQFELNSLKERLLSGIISSLNFFCFIKSKLFF